MAKYDRRLLVPYLQDVCSVELLYARCTRDVEECKNLCFTARRLENRKAEHVDKPNLFADLAWVLCGIIVIAILIFLVDNLLFPPLLFVLIAGVFGGIAVVYTWFVLKEYPYEMHKYRTYIAEKSLYDREKSHYQNMANTQEKKLVLLSKRLNRVKQLRSQVYGVNIIPNKYRNIHAAYYLFEYFNSCRENDLDKIIQTMLLDDIIKRLDKIIEQNEEILLNQRYQIALQEKQNRMIAENHREQMNAIARMEENQQLQADYLQMIVQNQAVNNFFLTYDFFNKKIM